MLTKTLLDTDALDPKVIVHQDQVSGLLRHHTWADHQIIFPRWLKRLAAQDYRRGKWKTKL